jgi:hypothetical protein
MVRVRPDELGEHVHPSGRAVGESGAAVDTVPCGVECREFLDRPAVGRPTGRYERSESEALHQPAHPHLEFVPTDDRIGWWEFSPDRRRSIRWWRRCRGGWRLYPACDAGDVVHGQAAANELGFGSVPPTSPFDGRDPCSSGEYERGAVSRVGEGLPRARSALSSRSRAPGRHERATGRTRWRPRGFRSEPLRRSRLPGRRCV